MVQLWVLGLYLGFTLPRLKNAKSEGKILHKIFQKSSLTVLVQFRFEPALYCLNLELDLRFSSIISLNFELNFEFGSKSSGSQSRTLAALIQTPDGTVINTIPYYCINCIIRLQCEARLSSLSRSNLLLCTHAVCVVSISNMMMPSVITL